MRKLLPFFLGKVVFDSILNIFFKNMFAVFAECLQCVWQRDNDKCPLELSRSHLVLKKFESDYQEIC